MKDQQPIPGCAVTNETAPTEGNGKDEDLFRTEEVVIEEMAIDGICGVY